MKLKRDTKFGEELTFHFKIGKKNLTKFDVNTLKSQKFSLYWDPFEQITFSLSWRSTEELSFMKLKRDTKFREELTSSFKTDTKNVTNFDLSTRLLNKLYIVWAKKAQRSCLSWHWRVMQNLKKNWLVAWKMTGIWKLFTRALESVKNGTLMGSYCPK